MSSDPRRAQARFADRRQLVPARRWPGHAGAAMPSETSSLGSAIASRSGLGLSWFSIGNGVSIGSPKAAASRPAKVVAARHGDSLAEDGPHGHLESVDGPQARAAPATGLRPWPTWGRALDVPRSRRAGRPGRRGTAAGEAAWARPPPARSRSRRQGIALRRGFHFHPAPRLAHAHGAQVPIVENRLDTHRGPACQELKDRLPGERRPIGEDQRQAVSGAVDAGRSANPRGRHGVVRSKQRVESSNAGETAGQGNLDHGQIRLGEKLLGQEEPAGLRDARPVRCRIPAGSRDGAVAKLRPRPAGKRLQTAVVVQAPASMRAAACRAVRPSASTGACPGASSGRHRRHGRKPACSAAAALAKNRQRSLRGVRAVQMGRQ